MSDRYRELHALSVAFLEAFNRYDLDGVMAYFTDDAVYEELTGRVSAVAFDQAANQGTKEYLVSIQGRIGETATIKVNIEEPPPKP